MGAADWSYQTSVDALIATLSDTQKAKLKRCLEALAAQETGQLTSAQEAFAAIDLDKNGNIEQDEFANVVKALDIRITDKECKEVWEDSLIDGKFQFEAFVALIMEGLQVTGTFALEAAALDRALAPAAKVPDGRSFNISFEIKFEHLNNWYISTLYHPVVGDGHLILFCHGGHPYWTAETAKSHDSEALEGLMKLSIKGFTGHDKWGDLSAAKRVVPEQWHSIVITKAPTLLTFSIDGEETSMETPVCEVRSPEKIAAATEASVPESWKEGNKKERNAGRKLFYGEIRNYCITYGELLT